MMGKMLQRPPPMEESDDDDESDYEQPVRGMSGKQFRPSGGKQLRVMYVYCGKSLCFPC